jgi:hypothetical protein
VNSATEHRKHPAITLTDNVGDRTLARRAEAPGLALLGAHCSLPASGQIRGVRLEPMLAGSVA